VYLSKIRLKNWLCYRGAQEISLEPIPYAVTATTEGDAERSNWSGKSALFESVRFALYGTHRKRLEDGWISSGEKEGEVDLTFSNGVRVRRWRGPGAGTQAEIVLGEYDARKGAEAQREIEAMLGLNEEDFCTTGFFAQGQTSVFVRAEPATRTAMVSRWLRLEGLERCASVVARRASAEEKRSSAVRGRLEAARERLARAGADQDVAPLEALLAEWDELLARASEEEANARLVEERERVIEEGKRLRAEHDAEDPGVLQRDIEGAIAEKESAQRVLDAARLKRANRVSVASGSFNGRCPVAGIECPVRAEINDLGEEAQREAVAAAAAEHDAHDALLSAQSAWRVINEKLVARRARQERLRTLQERARAMGAARPPGGGTGLAIGAVRAERDRVAGDLAALRTRIAEAEAARAEIGAHEASERSVSRLVAACREAGALFAGAKRRMAEGALAGITARANGILRDAGIELSVECSWERESKDPADVCYACGAAYPASARLKKCGECGEARGRKRIAKLEVELSDESGAALDLAGFATSLSAGAWLRGERGSPWGVLFADEPWAQLDRAHRRSASAYVPSLLAAARVEQAFMISHDPVSVSSLPGRIEIVRDGRWSRVSVAA
jgi:DNA repair exonuclease SbcCD ATPase subunit